MACLHFSVRFSPGAKIRNSSSVQLEIEINNMDPWSQDVELDLTCVSGLAHVVATSPFPVPSIPQCILPGPGRIVNVNVQGHGLGYPGTEVVECRRARYRVTGTTGWSAWHPFHAGNSASVPVT